VVAGSSAVSPPQSCTWVGGTGYKVGKPGLRATHVVSAGEPSSFSTVSKW